MRQRHFWSGSLHDQDIEVQVRYGRATLTGTVDTWPERQQAALEVYEAGARDVNNHLRVPDPAETATSKPLTTEPEALPADAHH
ncbi:BON domain-containing protein [Hymenobacter amundsenii]|uniref:BON domain-containing protein n=1 Tax=Hymenobacter amundsenii TaxID=2006685 RepID=UPI0021CDA63F|nr:BON domain-containing protein [Hymenobacter amundsenii]